MNRRACNPTLRCQCERSIGGSSFSYHRPPIGETAFDLKGSEYERGYWRCGLCQHEFADHQLDLSGLYEGAYVRETYGEQLLANFERILALPPDQSDNEKRVQRVLDFAHKFFSDNRRPVLLDVGSGLGVFPYRMKEVGYDCVALDPDPEVGAHLVATVGVQTVTADFFEVPKESLGIFDVVTLNKVIEHVEDPVSMLQKARGLLRSEGFLYVEVPDVLAARDGYEREEFFIEHHHVFSPASLAMTAERAGLDVLTMERMREPSGKFTLAMFGRRST